MVTYNRDVWSHKAEYHTRGQEYGVSLSNRALLLFLKCFHSFNELYFLYVKVGYFT